MFVRCQEPFTVDASVTQHATKPHTTERGRMNEMTRRRKAHVKKAIMLGQITLDFIRLELDQIIFLSQCNAREIRAAFPGESKQP